ncbi:MAG TPA: hypothetical protein VE262_21810 [Blastocatellia bacterium]|nr:hypothetical protein [Blastocatellia bacterium]
MTRAKFCPGCGERLAAKRSFLRATHACDNCAEGSRRPRILAALTLISCLLASFAIGRYTAERRPFYFIGSPIDPHESGPAPLDRTDRADAAGEQREPPQSISPPSPERETRCGARTLSGRPCKRKVRGGGRCWQHRSG